MTEAKDIHQPRHTELFGMDFMASTRGDLTFYLPLQPLDERARYDAELYRRIIPDTVTQLGALDAHRDVPPVRQSIVFCPPEMYWERFVKKADRFGFNPEPWHWSEGDIDEVEPHGRVFCVKLGADFRSDAEKARFLGHELDHPHINAIAPVIQDFNDLSVLADTEGIVEADARIGLGIQLHEGMEQSTDFLLGLKRDQLVPASAINTIGYDHTAFFGKQVSVSEGYGSAFLWFLGLAVHTSQQDIRPTLGVRDAYLHGRDKILTIAQNSKNIDEYKANLGRVGINYNELASDPTFLTWGQDLLHAYIQEANR